MIQADNLPEIYQFRAVLRELNPHIWRRIQVSGDSTIVDLHQAMQCAFNWTDRHSHQFKIRGRVFTLIGSTDEEDDLGTIPGLSEFRFFLKERFCHDYNFNHPLHRLACTLSSIAASTAPIESSKSNRRTGS